MSVIGLMLTRRILGWVWVLEQLIDDGDVMFWISANGSRISCCTKDGQHLEQHKRHPQCMPLDIAQDDPFYSRYNVRCVSAVRSMVAPRSQCNFGYAQQLNRVMRR